MRLRLVRKTIALAGVLLVVAAACSKSTTTTPASPTGSAPAVKKGGKVVIGAEQWPDCANPITSCSGLTWYWYTIGENIFPYAMVIDTKGNFVPSILTEAPTTDNGDITQNPFTVKLKIDPKAVWDDGTPITSSDIEFTWKAIMNTTGAYSQVGYDKIDSIDTTDPATAIIKFKSTYVDWPDLFGGVYQGIFKKAAFPNVNPDKPDLKGEMQNSVPFSGGPWILSSWTKQQAILLPNPKSFPRAVPNFDQVTEVPYEDLTTEVQAVVNGDAAAVYPQPPAASVQKQVGNNPDVKVVGSDGAYYDALWFNLDSAPLNDPKVREALMYGIDRASVVNQVVHENSPNSTILNCGPLAVPTIGPWCTEKPFEQFTFDPKKSLDILQADGYTCTTDKGNPIQTSAGDFPPMKCAKNGQALVVNYRINAPNTRRAATQELLKEITRTAGFSFNIKNSPDSGTYFDVDLPHGNFTMADYAQGGSNDPSNTGVLGCDYIPTKANQYTGSNYIHWCNKAANDAMLAADQELDPQKRLADLTTVYQAAASDFALLPLYVLPNLAVWRTDQITGPIADYIPSNLGMFYNMNEWYVPS